MKKLYTLVLACAAFSFASAQVTLLDNGPLTTHPAGHATGADRSAIWAIPNASNTFGYSNNLAGNFRMADDFTVPAGDTWNIDSIIFYAYQTQSAPFTTVSSITAVTVQIWDGDPADPLSSVIWGDTINDLMFSNTEWSGIYRTTSTDNASEARAIMRNQTEMLLPLSLTGGTYWVDWGTTGSLASGPWCPPVTIMGQNETGNGKQLTSAGWVNVVRTDTIAAVDYGQGWPMIMKGSVILGVNETAAKAQVKVYPNPFTSSTNFRFEANYFNTNRGNLNLSIYDAIGNLVSEVKNISDNNVEFNRGTLAAGFYMYEIKNADNSVAKGKLIIK